MKWVVFSLVLSAHFSFASTHENRTPLVGQLAEQDQIIYHDTFAICKPGTIGSAVRVGFNLSNFSSGVLNWLRYLSADLNAAQTVWNNKGLSPMTKKLQSSPGFWFAMTDCYGYRYGKLNYGNLMKQIVDIGHLTTDASSAIVGVASAQLGAKWTANAVATFPIASRFIFASVLSVSTWKLIYTIREARAKEMTPEENQELEEVESQIFSEPDRIILQVLKKAKEVITQIDSKLQSQDLTEQERAQLLEKRSQIQENINHVEALKARAS